MSSLMDRLKALGVTVGTSNVESQNRDHKSDRDLAQELGGETLETIYGPVIRIVNTYPVGFVHGNISCLEPSTNEIFRRWANLPEICEPNKFLFLDTETSGLSTGTGTFAFLVGIGFFKDHEFRLIQYFLESPANESAMLAGLIQDAVGTDTFVTYNGKSFDIPLLRSRFILNRMENILDAYYHADLLHITRKVYKLFLPERNLGVVEKEILNFKRDELEVPGWMVPEIYAEFLQNHDPQPIKRVLYHNQIDIISLAALYQHINQLLDSTLVFQIDAIPSQVLITIIRLYIEFQQLETAAELFSKYSCDLVDAEEYAKTAFLLGMSYKQIEQLDKAIHYWKIAANLDNLSAMIELAKYFEHTLAQYQIALDYTLNAKRLCEKAFPQQHQLKEDLEKRINRLQRLLSESVPVEPEQNLHTLP
jgi:uncharacterized protein